jgi:hypothetical protein
MNEYLVAYDYGQGSVWAFLSAESETQIAAEFPELAIVHDRPDWLTDERARQIRRAHSYDMRDQPRGLLQDIIAARTR